MNLSSIHGRFGDLDITVADLVSRRRLGPGFLPEPAMWVAVVACIFVVAPAVDLMVPKRWRAPQFLGSVQFRIASGRSHCWFSAVSACGEFLLSVLSSESGKFMWHHVTSHETASASPWWYMSSEVGLLIVAARKYLSFPQ
ncbi:hypothetical protein F2Q69_00016377 [Brassica cretica]|uniref:Uncharacterized protein n=1 Tax=Brassica cretica TaxID=69181 RepID=A0A8S9QVT5_BRACR|nr:hypothetical protein F2Q69_00016377 [Brassica cretica]